MWSALTEVLAKRPERRVPKAAALTIINSLRIYIWIVAGRCRVMLALVVDHLLL